MARYMVSTSTVDVVGNIWMPNTTAAYTYTLSGYDIENIKARNPEGKLTREAIQGWLDTHAGDFQSITDFHASIDDWESPWSSEDNECTFMDCMYPEES